MHTLRYRLPELDTMAGLRRITLCSNTQLGDVGVSKLLDVLADDLWIMGTLFYIIILTIVPTLLVVYIPPDLERFCEK